jgi:S-adenosylmethionine-dependent methyltransferase
VQLASSLQWIASARGHGGAISIFPSQHRKLFAYPAPFGSDWFRDNMDDMPAGELDFEMRPLNAARFNDAHKYASYLNTVAGKLRSDLAWEFLRGSLPTEHFGLRALDLGGGTGTVSVRLAQMGFEVVLLDRSEDMLRVAQKNVEGNEIAARIAFREADADRLDSLFEPNSFDVVVCHNLLEYVAEPAAILRGIAGIIKKNAIVSVLARNRAGEVLKAAIKSADWRLAKEYLSADTVTDSLFGEPVRVFDRTELIQMFADAGLALIAEYGVRVFSDYVDSEDLDNEGYRQLYELELTLGAQPQFAAVARYSQLIARGSGAMGSPGTR